MVMAFLQAGVIEEMVNDSLDSALDSEDIEEETEEEVDKVLSDLAVETTAQLPTAARREKHKPEEEFIAEVGRSQVCVSVALHVVNMKSASFPVL